jgi:hypothetical protein
MQNEISIAPDGTLRFVVSKELEGLLTEDAEVKRASHVEPVNPYLRRVFHFLRSHFNEYGWVAAFTRLWPCEWRINLGPIGQGILYQTYRNRSEAIDAEVEWLNVHYI